MCYLYCVPEGVKSAAVVVVVHGESYTWGSGSAYDGSVLCQRGNLIVVTLNYRLGILGNSTACLEY